MWIVRLALNRPLTFIVMAIAIMLLTPVAMLRTPTDIFPNCPRYIPHVETLSLSEYVPAVGAEPVEPKWKSFGVFSDVVPPRRR